MYGGLRFLGGVNVKFGSYYIDEFWLIFIGAFFIFSIFFPWMLTIVVVALVYAVEKNNEQ